MKHKSKLISAVIIAMCTAFVYYSLHSQVEAQDTGSLFFEKEIYKKPALEALTYYPELKDCNIRFVDAGQSKIAHQAIPKNGSLFKKRSKRIYLVKIASDQYGVLDSTLFKNLDYQSQVGVLGHELAHILDYTDESLFKLLGKGIKYKMNKKYRKNYELNTNLEAIDRGLRQQILSWSREVHSYLLQDGRGEMYHSPGQIEALQLK